MTEQTELETLRAEVARLRSEVAMLRNMLTIVGDFFKFRKEALSASQARGNDEQSTK